MANFLFTGFQDSGLSQYNPNVASVARSVARDHIFNTDNPSIGSFHLPPTISLNHHPQHHPHLTVRPTVPSSTARISRVTSNTTPVTLAPRTSNLYSSKIEPNHANMRPYFHFEYNDTILFNSWVLKSTWDTLLTCLAFLLLAILYEAIKCYREHLYKRLSFTVRKQMPMTISSPTAHYLSSSTSSFNNANSVHHHLHHTPAGGGNISQTNLRRDSNIGISPQMSPASGLGVSTSSSLGDSRKSRLTSSSSSKSNLNIRIFSLPHLIQTLLHLVQVILAYTLMLGFMTFNAWICLSIIFGAGLGYYLFYWRKITIVHVSDCH